MEQYVNIVYLFAIGLGFGLTVVVLSRWVRPKRAGSSDLSPYECGVDVVEAPTSQNRSDVRFYLVAILFLLFDLEVVFLYPWAYIFKEVSQFVGPFLLIEMGIFVGVLLVGLFYIWKKDVLIW